MARTMLNENDLPKYFWVKAINTPCYVFNKVLLRLLSRKLPMSFEKTRNPILPILRYLVANILF